LYISIRPVTLTRFASILESVGDLFTGDAGGIHPVKVWFGYAAPIFSGWLTKFSLVALFWN
jgi:hypothetical protein